MIETHTKNASSNDIIKVRNLSTWEETKDVKLQLAKLPQFSFKETNKFVHNASFVGIMIDC